MPQTTDRKTLQLVKRSSIFLRREAFSHNIITWPIVEQKKAITGRFANKVLATGRIACAVRLGQARKREQGKKVFLTYVGRHGKNTSEMFRNYFNY